MLLFFVSKELLKDDLKEFGVETFVNDMENVTVNTWYNGIWVGWWMCRHISEVDLMGCFCMEIIS